MGVLFALLSALSSAVNLLTQRVSSRVGPHGIWRLTRYLLRQPLWLLGLGAMVAAFVLQAAALRNARLSVVQPLLVTELVFVLVLRRLWLRQSVVAMAWGAAALVCVSLTVFLVAAEPRGGIAVPASASWAKSLAGFGAASVVLTLLARRGTPARRAALYALAAAIVGALSAACIKTVTTDLTVHGPVRVLTDWPVYLLAVTGVASALLVQAALHVGPLTVSQPIMVVVNPVVSIWLSVVLFEEYFTRDAAVLALAAVGFALIVVGVVLLTRSAPREDVRHDREPLPGPSDVEAVSRRPPASAATGP